jgi:hypothetical protein
MSKRHASNKNFNKYKVQFTGLFMIQRIVWRPRYRVCCKVRSGTGSLQDQKFWYPSKASFLYWRLLRKTSPFGSLPSQVSVTSFQRSIGGRSFGILLQFLGILPLVGWLSKIDGLLRTGCSSGVQWCYSRCLL